MDIIELLRLISIVSMVTIVYCITRYIAPLNIKILYTEKDWKKRLNRLSFLWGVPGIVMMMIGDSSFLRDNTELVWHELHYLLLFWGLFLWFVSCGFEARKRWRHFAWGLLGLCPFLIGALFIPMLKDHSNIILKQTALNKK